MGWMFKRISPEFVKKAKIVGVDAENVRFGVYCGADRIVWYSVKEKFEAKVNASSAEIKREVLDRVFRKMCQTDFLSNARKSLAKISDKHVISGVFHKYGDKFFTMEWRLVAGGAEDAGGACLSVKAAVEDDFSVSFMVTFHGLEGKAASKMFKTADFEMLGNILNERIVWGNVEPKDVLLTCISRVAVKEAAFLCDLGSRDIKTVKILGRGEWAVVSNDGEWRLAVKFEEQGEEMLALYAMNEKSCLNGKISLPMIADKLNNEGVVNIKHNGYIYLLELGNDYERGYGRLDLLTLRSRI